MKRRPGSRPTHLAVAAAAAAALLLYLSRRTTSSATSPPHYVQSATAQKGGSAALHLSHHGSAHVPGQVVQKYLATDDSGDTKQQSAARLRRSGDSQLDSDEGVGGQKERLLLFIGILSGRGYRCTACSKKVAVLANLKFAGPHPCEINDALCQ